MGDLALVGCTCVSVEVKPTICPCNSNMLNCYEDYTTKQMSFLNLFFMRSLWCFQVSHSMQCAYITFCVLVGNG